MRKKNNIDLPFCACGCGKHVKINQNTKQPNKYLNGHNTGVKETILKKKLNCLKTRGYEHTHQDPKVKEKLKKTFFKKYGTEYCFQSEEVKNKIKKTNLKKYGVENPTQNKKIKKKQISSLKENYGVYIPYKNEKIKQRGIQTCLTKFGVDNYSKTLEFREFARKQMIKFIMSGYKDRSKFSPMIGKNEPQFIQTLQQYTNYQIITDQEIRGLFPDGYIKELKIVIEFDEPWHKNKWAQEHDDVKNRTYAKYHLKIFRVWESEWLENKKPILKKFQELINECRKIKTNTY
jgi:very-short-patch-repair endonuclease